MFKNLFSQNQDKNNSLESETRLRSLEETVERYERIFRGSRGYGFLDWDFKAEKMHWDGGFWEYLGYDDSDFATISDPSKFMEFVHQDDRDKVTRMLHNHLRKPGAGEMIFRLRKKKGGYVWTEGRVDTVRDRRGWVTYMSGIVFDVTKLKQTEQALLTSEARHARIIQSSNDGIWEWSAETGGFHFSNRCWELLGYSEHDDVLTLGTDRWQAWRALMHKEDLVRFDRVLDCHIKNGTPFDVEYRIKGKNNQWCWVRGRGQMSFNEKGHPTRMSGTNMDITQLKLAEERVLKAKESAEKANQAKSEFLSSMSHELRTPLNAILGFAQLFDLDKNLSSDQRSNVGEIKKAGEHLLQLIGDVLDLAKIEAGRMTFSLEKVAPVRILEECGALFVSQAKARGIHLKLQTKGFEDKTIKADGVRLKQVVINLIGNAIKYNRDRGSVTITCSSTDNGEFRITVKDTGIGIPENMHSDLFQPFNRLGAEGSSIEGSGVGLVITKQLVEQMGGRLDFSSEEGVGSKFSIQFPFYSAIDKEYEVDQGHPETGKNQAIPDLLVREKKRVLYVEDNPSNQRLMQQILGRYPEFDLEIADEALRGIYLGRVTKPDLIILDINLPGMDGHEVVSVLKQDPATKNIPVIALSANAMLHDMEKGRRSGFNHYLTKPVNIAQLIEVCNELLGS